MLTIISCITVDHDLSLVLLAALLCGFGSWVTSRLYRHARNRSERQAMSWYLLTALTAAVSIWGTHFVAMLGFRPSVPVNFDLSLTLVSFVIAAVGCALGILVSTLTFTRYAPAIGGAILGLAVAGMHYAGMIAYRVQGIVDWHMGYLLASIAMAAGFGALALVFGERKRRSGEFQMAITLTVAIVLLHFTGMTAFNVSPLDISGDFVNPAALKVLALGISGTAIVIVMGALLSYAIENRTWKENIGELIEARNAAESASRAKSEFLSILSHELRTPLTIVLGYAGLLSQMNQAQAGRTEGEENRIGDQAELYGKKITTAATHLLSMINEILDYTSMELGDPKLDRVSFPVGKLLEKVREHYATAAAEKSMTIEIEGDDITAHADYKRCLQILINLVGNAVRFSGSDRIVLRARRTASGFDMEVEDFGRGIPAEHHQRIFNAFQQVEAPDDRAEGGAGLGLAVCNVLALAHGGTITLRSAEGEGATFTVSMPQSAVDTNGPAQKDGFGPLRLAS